MAPFFLAKIMELQPLSAIELGLFVPREVEILSPEMRELIGVRTLLIEYASREEQGRGTFQPIEFDESPMFTPEDVDFMAEVGIARLFVNSYKTMILVHEDGTPSQYGRLAMDANENPHNLHHGAPHDRRAERMMDAQYTNILALRSPEVKQWVISSYLAASQHDITQKIVTYRNQKEGLKGKNAVDEKQGHALEAAFIPYLMRHRIAKELMVNHQEAERITAGMWFMTALHDEPDIYEKAIRCTDPVKAGETLDQIYARFKKGEVDLTTITKKQWVLMAVKEKMRFQKNGDPSLYNRDPLGFVPELVEEYGDGIYELLNDNTPLFSNLTPEDREGLIQASLTYEWADTVEFSAPYAESLGRKLETKYSADRPLLCWDITALTDYVNFLRSEKGLEKLDAETDLADIMLYDAVEGTGNLRGDLQKLDSDTRRVIWELLHLNDWGSKFRREYNKDTAIMGILGLRNIVGGFMQGDITTFDNMVMKNCVKLGEKLLRRQGFSEKQLDFVRKTCGNSSTFMKIVEKYLMSKDEALGMRYKEIKEHTMKQRLDILTNLSVEKKPITQTENETKKMTIHTYQKQDETLPLEIEMYSSEQMVVFKRFLDKTVDILKEKYEVTDDEMNNYERLVNEEKPAPRQPYDTYLTTSTVDKMTLLKAPHPAAWAYVESKSRYNTGKVA